MYISRIRLAFCLLWCGLLSVATFGGGRNICESYDNAAAVFIGKVTSSIAIVDNFGKSSYPCVFEVIENFKGADSEYLRVLCYSGSNVKPQGTEVLVFAHSLNGQLILDRYSICSELSKVEGDLRYLRSFAHSNSARLSGIVTPNVGNIGSLQTGLSGKLVGPEEQVLDLSLSENGVYDVSGLAAGSYKLMISDRNGLIEPRSTTVELAEGTCKILNLILPTTGGIRGRLWSKDKKLPIRAVHAEAVNQVAPDSDCSARWAKIDGMELISPWDLRCSDPNTLTSDSTNDGEYLLTSLLPGLYLVSVDILRDGHLQKFYYPGTTDRTLAVAIDVDKDLVAGDFTNFPETEFVKVSGVLAVKDTKNLPNFILIFNLLADDEKDLSGSEFRFVADIDKYGNFMVNLPSMFSYSVHWSHKVVMLMKNGWKSPPDVPLISVGTEDIRGLKIVEGSGKIIIVQK